MEPTHAAAGSVDLVDARLGDLLQVLAVEGGAGVGALVEPAGRGAAGRIDGHQRRAGRGPDLAAVLRHAADLGHLGERAVLAHDLGRALGGCGMSWRSSSSPSMRLGLAR